MKPRFFGGGVFCRKIYQDLFGAVLAERFKKYDGGRGRQIKRAHGARHRDGKQAAFVAFVKVFGQAARFRAEDEVCPVRDVRVPVRLRSLGGKEKHVFFRGMFGV